MKHHDFDSLDGLSGGVSDLRQALEAKRDELVRNYIRLEIAVEKVPALMDQAVAATVRNLAAEQLERNGFLLHHVLDALDRIAQGLYGKCVNCGEPVCAEGLAALPWVALCQPCQQVLDSRRIDGHPTIFHAA
jgi:RNA polymerase-binding transcription factor